MRDMGPSIRRALTQPLSIDWFVLYGSVKSRRRGKRRYRRISEREWYRDLKKEAA